MAEGILLGALRFASLRLEVINAICEHRYTDARAALNQLDSNLPQHARIEMAAAAIAGVIAHLNDPDPTRVDPEWCRLQLLEARSHLVALRPCEVRR